MITPQEASKRNDQLHAEQLVAAEKAIDAILVRGFISGRSVSIDVKDIPIKDHILRDKLLARYKDAGWQIKKDTGDQRDWYEHYVFSSAPQTHDYFGR
jgi:hypothetical protein